MGKHSDFLQIKTLYDRKKKDIKNTKLTGVLIWVGGVAGWFFLLGLLWNPAVTIGIAIGVLILGIIGIVLFKKR